jgi:hypothetical protein
MLTQYKPVFPTLNELSTYNGKKAYIPLSFVNDNGEEANKTDYYITHFIKEQYGPLPREGGKFNITREQRNCFNTRLDKNDNNSKLIIDDHDIFETAYEEQKEKIYENNTLYEIKKDKKGKETKKELFQFINCIKEKQNDENVYGMRLNFKPKYFPYYNDEKLDDNNRRNMNNLIFPKNKPTMRGDKLKEHKNSLEFDINYPQGSTETKKIKYKNDIEEKKEFSIRVIYREVVLSKDLTGDVDGIRYINEDTKKPDEYNNNDLDDEENLTQFIEDYGQPTNDLIIETPEELEKYCRPGSYYRYGISYEFQNEKSVPKKVVECGVRTFCHFVEIIFIKQQYTKLNNNNNNAINQLYKKSSMISPVNSVFKFDEKDNTNTDQSTDDKKTSDNKSSDNSSDGSDSDSDSDSDSGSGSDSGSDSDSN